VSVISVLPNRFVSVCRLVNRSVDTLMAHRGEEVLGATDCIGDWSNTLLESKARRMMNER